MALDKITAQSLEPGAVTVAALPDGVVTATKLHTTAITDKLGYTPAPTNNPTLTGTITLAGGSTQEIVFDRTIGDNWIGSSVVIENGNISIFEPPTNFYNWLNTLQAGDTFTIQPGGQELTVASTSNSFTFVIVTEQVIDQSPGADLLPNTFWITSFTQTISEGPDVILGTTPLSDVLASKANTSALGSLASLSTIDTINITDGAVTAAKLGSNAVFLTQFAARTSQHSLAGDSGWVDHVSMNFTLSRACNCLFIYSSSSSYESGTVQGFARLMLDGTMVGFNSAVAKQSTANAAGAGTCFWDRQNLSAGTHTIKIQLRNLSGTWITPYYSADGQTANALGVLYYG